MAFKETLESGALGLTLRFPDDWKVAADEEHHLQIVDYSRGALWWVFFVPELNMDLTGPFGTITERVEQHTRFMFNTAYEADSIKHNRPRTDDPEWSPLIDCDEIMLKPKVQALQILHRMHYRPGRETILGHIILPRAAGLVEARVLTVDEQTGLREALLTASLLDSSGVPADDFIPPTQRVLDSADHDPSFAEHCLSRARGAMRWLHEDADLEVGPEKLIEPSGVNKMREIGASIAPPPGFYRVASHPGLFTRSVFGATDGFEQFFVEQHSMQFQPGDLATVAKDRTLRICHGASIDVASCEVYAGISCNGREDVLVVVEGKSFDGQVRNAVHWLLDDSGTPWSLGRTGSAATPEKQLAVELERAARTWAPLR